VLTIYRDVVPRKKYMDDDFINVVERLVMKMVGNCPLDVVSVATACLCAIVDRVSHKYNILIKMLGTCVGKFPPPFLFFPSWNIQFFPTPLLKLRKTSSGTRAY
jgi:hypothetical protein